MNIQIRLIKIEEREILRKMLFTYEQELSGIDNPEEYKYLDLYWSKETRKPYFILVKKVIAGFILLNRHTLVQIDGYNIAEFYVLPKFRLRGTGSKAATAIFDTYKERWEVRQLSDNLSARLFWNKIIKEYTANDYEEIWLDNDKWHGSVQIFEN